MTRVETKQIDGLIEDTGKRWKQRKNRGRQQEFEKIRTRNERSLDGTPQITIEEFKKIDLRIAESRRPSGRRHTKNAQAHTLVDSETRTVLRHKGSL